MNRLRLLQTDVASPTGGHTIPLPTNQPDPGTWSLPFPVATPNVSFAYPEEPSSVAPPHHQPMSELHTQDPNLGFATLGDWFGQSGENDLLDLQDFWFQVGPGEAQGGFPFR